VPRYITRAAKPGFIETPLWGDEEKMRPHLSVDDHDPVFTGLLDAKGDEIWRAPNPMGFGRNEDW
jgi:hypothetical protein